MALTIRAWLTALAAVGAILYSTNALAVRDCPRPGANEPALNKGEFTLIESLAEAASIEETIYTGGRRLANRAYLENGRYRLPDWGEVPLPEAVIAAVVSHVEQALAAGYADHVVYSDMGHVHVYAPSPGGGWSVDIERSDLKFVYHTAEMIRLREGDWFKGELVPDPYLRWRYYSRNLLGVLDPEKGLTILFEKKGAYNTVRGLPSHREITTLYFSASEQGCFAFRTPAGLRYLDIGGY